MLDVAGAHATSQGAVAFTAFRQRHLQRPLHGVGDVVEIVGVDDQGLFEIFGGPGSDPVC